MVVHFIFDLDGTLYSFKETGVGLQMRHLINEFIADEFKMSPDKAEEFAERCYKEYGLTARGIQVELKVSPITLRKYTGYVHGVDTSKITFQPELVKAFKCLYEVENVHLWILTNSTKTHTAACLAQIGISNYFRDPVTGSLRIIDCYEQWKLSPAHTAECKPLRVAYDLMMNLTGVQEGDTCVMVEDALRNLDEPKKMGWKTVFIADGRKEVAEEARAAKHTLVVDRVMEAMPTFMQWGAVATPTVLKKE